MTALWWFGLAVILFFFGWWAWGSFLDSQFNGWSFIKYVVLVTFWITLYSRAQNSDEMGKL